jgi:hypothetical protein
MSISIRFAASVLLVVSTCFSTALLIKGGAFITTPSLESVWMAYVSLVTLVVCIVLLITDSYLPASANDYGEHIWFPRIAEYFLAHHVQGLILLPFIGIPMVLSELSAIYVVISSW